MSVSSSKVKGLFLANLGQPIVHSASAYVGVVGEIRNTIYANHRDMCRFVNDQDPGYIKIAHAITELVKNATLNISSSGSTVSQPSRSSIHLGEEQSQRSFQEESPGSS